jgi:hypothetical protein
MLGTLIGQVNENRGTDERRKSKSSDFRLSRVLAYRVVKKGVCGDLDFSGLSPPCFASPLLVRPVYLLRLTGNGKISDRRHGEAQGAVLLLGFPRLGEVMGCGALIALGIDFGVDSDYGVVG